MQQIGQFGLKYKERTYRVPDNVGAIVQAVELVSIDVQDDGSLRADCLVIIECRKAICWIPPDGELRIGQPDKWGWFGI